MFVSIDELHELRRERCGRFAFNAADLAAELIIGLLRWRQDRKSLFSTIRQS